MATRDTALILIGGQAALGAIYLALWLVREPYVYAFGVLGGTALGSGLVIGALISFITGPPEQRWLVQLAAVFGVVVHAIAWKAMMGIHWA
jgi:hypothetical protein